MKRHHGASASNELVINWHLTEACNYSCRYCYSKWHGHERELLHDAAGSERLLAELYRHFAPDNLQTQAHLGMRWDSVRLSLAGGEPLLYPDAAVRIASQAKSMGFRISMITNGSRLTNGLMRELAPLLSVLGLSLDSGNAEIKRRIGRADRKLQVLSLGGLATTIKEGRRINPEMRLKINTVVNALNFADDLGSTIRALSPEKWKVLRALPVISDELAVTDRQFSDFLGRHHSLQNIISAEDNSDMVESYIMIDPQGRFFQNNLDGQGYRYSSQINEVGANAAFGQIRWQATKFLSRYASIPERLAA
jgi:radical S-adenosyl methionine domain-containing protein 2